LKTFVKNSPLHVFWPTVIVLGLDQLTKVWVRTTMPLGESIPVLGREFFLLTHVENTGVAFSIQAGGAPILAVFNGLASAVLVYILLKSRRAGSERYPRLVEIALALILGGALGNLIDRAFFGHVTDFLDFDFPDFIMTRWPVFNVADSSVTVGVTLWCVHLVFFSKPHKKNDSLLP
jgi:signal peptidase II